MDDRTLTPEDSAAQDRQEVEFDYVVGRITERDVLLDGQVVVPQGTQVTAAEATSALAAGVLEDLAFAVGMGDPSYTNVQSVPEDVEGSMDPMPEPQEGIDPLPGAMLGMDQPPGAIPGMDQTSGTMMGTTHQTGALSGSDQPTVTTPGMDPDTGAVTQRETLGPDDF